VTASQQASSSTASSSSSTRADSTARMTIILASVRPHMVHVCVPAAPPSCAAALGVVAPPVTVVPVAPPVTVVPVPRAGADVTSPLVCCRAAVDVVTESDAPVTADVMTGDATAVASC